MVSKNIHIYRQDNTIFNDQKLKQPDVKVVLGPEIGKLILGVGTAPGCVPADKKSIFGLLFLSCSFLSISRLISSSAHGQTSGETSILGQ